MSKLSVIYAECLNKAHCAECCFAECGYAEFRYAECGGSVSEPSEASVEMFASDKRTSLFRPKRLIMLVPGVDSGWE